MASSRPDATTLGPQQAPTQQLSVQRSAVPQPKPHDDAPRVLHPPVRLLPPDAADALAGTPVAASGPRAGTAQVAPKRGSGSRAITGTALTILAALVLGFVAEVAILGGLRHTRDQQTSLADFRFDLANGVAPVGQVDFEGVPLTPGDAVAILQVPRLGLREIVAEGTTSELLMSGPGHRRDTPLPGQPGTSVVMGRQSGYGGPFGGIKDLRAGDPITVVTGQGEASYSVIAPRREGDLAPPALIPGAGRLTLVTADGTGFAPSGLLRVDADLVSEPQPAAQRALTSAGLAPSEQAMAGEPAATIMVLLWAQALLIAAGLLTWARVRWGRWQTWVVGVPVLAAIALSLSDQVARLLPNVL